VTISPQWWHRPRRISIVVDNPSWIVPFAERLVRELCASGDDAVLARDYEDISVGAVAFFLGCIHIAPLEILARNQRNLVVHESDLPKGRGFAPLTWQILEGKNHIPICLVEAAEAVDSGPVIDREWISYEGHELLNDLRQRAGEMTISLCQKYVNAEVPPTGKPQLGEPTFYSRRRPIDSQLDPQRSILEQFNLLRVVDNDRYPAWFEHFGRRYRIKIERID